MYKNFKFILALLISAFVMTNLIACSDDDSTSDYDNGKVVKVVLSRKTNYGNDWIYFSLSKGREVAGINESNRDKNLDWDLAFNRFNIRTNSGLSGKGKGGAMDTGKTRMRSVKSVPAGEFTVDVMGEISKDLSAFPPPTMKSPLNEVLADAIFFQGPPPEYIFNQHVYIVRTADGKYAKFKVTGFHNDEGVSGFVNFEYQYQADGSQIFE